MIANIVNILDIKLIIGIFIVGLFFGTLMCWSEKLHSQKIYPKVIGILSISNLIICIIVISGIAIYLATCGYIKVTAGYINRVGLAEIVMILGAAIGHVLYSLKS